MPTIPSESREMRLLYAQQNAASQLRFERQQREWSRASTDARRDALTMKHNAEHRAAMERNEHQRRALEQRLSAANERHARETAVPCPLTTCRAPVGRWCKTSGGSRADHNHRARLALVASGSRRR